MKDKGTILVVEDTAADLELLVDSLTAEGYQVLPAENGELALASVAARPPELILLDIQMPGLDGFEVCRRLKARPESRDIPILFVSVSGERAERLAGLKLGAVDYLTKPFEREDLLARVQTHLELGRLRLRLERQAAELRRANEQLQSELAERKRTAEALRQSEEQLRVMFDLASVGIAQADPHTGQWLRVNQKMCEITGYTAGDLLQMRVPDITHPEDRQCDWGAFERVVRGEAPNYRMEKRYIRKDGALAWVNVNMTILRDAAGQPTRTVAAIEDITERKQMEAERDQLIQDLRESLASVKSLSGLLPICAGCKQIRDDKGYWSQVESYIQRHSEATFTHGLCPDCIKKYYPELDEAGPGDSG